MMSNKKKIGRLSAQALFSSATAQVPFCSTVQRMDNVEWRENSLLVKECVVPLIVSVVGCI
jgi:hypothetical protein